MISSLGTCLLDSFEWIAQDGTHARASEVRFGGGGVYAALGARMWTRDVGVVVQRGPDFPSSVHAQLDMFGSLWRYRDIQTPTPRALNTSRPPSPTRHFRYLTPPPLLSPSDLLSDPLLSQTTHLHLCCTPAHLKDVVLPGLSDFSSSPLLFYEPIPFACTPDALGVLIFVLPFLCLFSPNHHEAGAFLDLSKEEMDSTAAVERVAQRFQRLGAGDTVIRSGAQGAYVLGKGEKEGVWVPPFHRDPEKVKDTLGAGNAFLGGLIAGLVRHPNDLVLAARHGAVSAGVVVESEGLPDLIVRGNGEEHWNGRSAQERWEGVEKPDE